jgi:hypothetical protein
MRKPIILTIMLLLFCLAGAYGQKEKQLEGIWVMTYSKWDLPDTTIERTRFDMPSYKIFAKPHFSMSRLDENGEFLGHFGEYSFDGKHYTEHIQYSSYEYLVGRTEKFSSTVKGDEWTIKGKIGNKGEGFALVEIWRRVK